ncbi:hypothetical protein D3871_26190 [Noviherbaspirillum saxi]|uniref:Uncharacterized protein n=2 Tax=Noviherbaspirillum saxi TaxID=2320863 RepID=A0A3A3FL96_9BURK|nr:hypothetical protein D3871_26190 [Noviherbaspirillum saxi]
MSGIPLKKEEKTRRLLRHVSPDMLKATQSLIGEADDRQTIRKGQNPELAKAMMEYSAVPIPDGLKHADFSYLPFDLLAYTDANGQMCYMMIEGNGTGYAGTTNLSKEMQQVMLDTFMDTAKELLRELNGKHPPLVLVGCSGREGTGGNNKMVFEKLYIADEFNGVFKAAGTSHILTIDAIAPEYRQAIESANKTYEAAIKPAKEEKAAAMKDLETNYNAAREEAEGNKAPTDKLAQLKETYESDKQTIETKFYTDTAVFFEKWGNDCKQAVQEAKDYVENSDFSWDKYPGPTTVPGYTSEFSEFIEVDDDGKTTLFGREVDAIVNDRTAGNVSANNPDKEMKNVRVINSCYKEGQDKAAMAKAWNNFILEKKEELDAMGALVPGMDRTIPFKEVTRVPAGEGGLTKSDADLLCENIVDVFTNGLDDGSGGKVFPDEIMIKPSGTGKGDGIRAIKRSMLNDPEKIKQIVNSSLSEVGLKYRGAAGMPYMLQERVKIHRIRDGEFAGRTWDYRHVVTRYTNTDNQEYLVAFPAVAKVAADEDAVVNNTSAAMATTNRPGSDFIIPLCGDRSKEVDLNAGDMEKVGLVLTMFMAHLLENNYINPRKAQQPA